MLSPELGHRLPASQEPSSERRERPTSALDISVVGGVAAVAALASFIETTWLGMPLPVQVTLLTAIPLLAMVATQALAGRPGHRPLASLCALVAVGGTWIAVFIIARLLDLPLSPLLMWPPVCVGLAVALSHGFVWLAAVSVVGATVAVASISFVAAGAPWMTVFQRWEPLLMTAIAWLVLSQRLVPLGMPWVVMVRRTALSLLMVALLVLSGLDGMSLLPYAPMSALLLYQGASLIVLALLARWQRRLGDPVGLRLVGAAVLVFLLGRYLDWRSTVVPAWLFFLLVTLAANWMARRAGRVPGGQS
jgi:hypothetical protein